jgi:N-methylhydantoinase A
MEGARPAHQGGGTPPLQSRPLYADGRWRETRVLAREHLGADARIEGPAVVEQFDATTVIEPGAVATIDAVGNLRIKVGGAA